MSILLYIFTFLFGFIVDSMDRDHTYTQIIRVIYLLWFSVFMCFGYMTGSDWRVYETIYYDQLIDGIELNTEIVSYGILYWCANVIKDFFVALAFLKILFLCSLISLLKKFTSYWMSALVILMPLSLLLLLIDNPLRFMIALAFFNWAFIAIINHKYLIALFLVIISVLSHNGAVFCIIFLLCYQYADKIFKIPSRFLLTLYGCTFVLSVFRHILYLFITNINATATEYLGTREYATFYINEDTQPASTFTLGLIFYMILFVYILWTRKSYFQKYYENSLLNRQIFSLCCLFFIIQPLAGAIPVCYRLIFPGGYFLAIFLVENLREFPLRRATIIAYLLVVMVKNIWLNFVYLPYSNSIPYILTQHLPYEVRFEHNLDAYYSRFNKEFEYDY